MVGDDPLRDTMAGTLGHFWHDLGDARRLDISRSSDGFVRLVDGTLFHIETLRTREEWEHFGSDVSQLPTPEVAYGMTNVTRSVFFDLAGVAQSNVMGSRASTQTVRTRGVVTGVPLSRIASGEFTEVEIRIPEVTLWSGLVGIDESVDRYEDGRSKTWQASIPHTETLELAIRRGLNLTLSTTWSVEGPADRRILSTPLVVGTHSVRPRPWDEHLAPLLAVQDLINLAYEGFVTAERGNVQFRYDDDGQPHQRPQMWNSRLMTLPRSAKAPESMTQFPVFTLRQIGGVRGLRNWIRLDERYPRATGPLSSLYRYGAGGVEMRLAALALGIEYWTKVHSSAGAKWAQPARKKEPMPMAIGRHVGPAFAEFVGDLEAWSELFWRTYNQLKHAPNFEYDPYEIHLLGESGALLLQGVLLNRVAGNRKLMKVLCESHRNHRLMSSVQKLVGRD